MKRNDMEIETGIKKIQNSKCWVVEGVFGHLIDCLVSCADTLIYIDLPWGECKKNLLDRGSESSEQLDHKKAEGNFQALLEWASEYDTRESKSSKNYHQSLFDCFPGETYRVCNRDEIYQVLKRF